MTITIEAPAVLSLTEQRRRAISALAPSIIERPEGYEAFTIPEGYTVIEEEGPGPAGPFLVTAVEAGDRDKAVRLGLVIPDGVTHYQGREWVAPTERTNDVSGAIVRGCRARTGITTAVEVLEPGELICFDHGTVARYYPLGSTELLNPGHALNVIHEHGEPVTPRSRSLASMSGHRWVRVEAIMPGPADPIEIGAASAEEAPARPFAVIPDGWKVVPTEDAVVIEQDVYAITVSPGFEHRKDEIEGRIVPARRSNRDDGKWLCIPRTALSLFLNDAAMLGLVPLEGKHYLYADGTIAVGVGDGVTRDVSDAYRLMPRNMDHLEIEAVPAEPAEPAEPAGCGYHNDGVSMDSPLLGLASSSAPELDPEPVVGTHYISWSAAWSRGGTSELLLCVPGDGEGELMFVSRGMYRASGGTDGTSMTVQLDPTARTSLTYRIPVRMMADRGTHWVRATLPKVTAPEGECNSLISASLATLASRKEEYSAALNEMAERESWCSEYEAIVQPLGFPGRVKKIANYRVTVDTRFTSMDSTPTSAMDDSMREIFDEVTFDLSHVELAGGAVFTIEVNGIESGDDEDAIGDAIREYLDDDILERHLSTLLGAASVTVDSWSVDEYEEID